MHSGARPGQNRPERGAASVIRNTHRVRLLAALAAAAALTSAAAVSRSSPSSAPADPPAQEALGPAEARYTVREYMGVVAVFSGDKLVRLTDCAVAALPARDRASLAAGVAVEDEQSLAMLLEDYAH